MSKNYAIESDIAIQRERRAIEENEEEEEDQFDEFDLVRAVYNDFRYYSKVNGFG
jgi:hypothetical protein